MGSFTGLTNHDGHMPTRAANQAKQFPELFPVLPQVEVNFQATSLRKPSSLYLWDREVLDFMRYSPLQ